MELAFFFEKASHLGKETSLASVVDSILSKLDQQDGKENDGQTLPRQGRIVL